MYLNGFIYSATLLFFVFDPFASLPIFIALTKDYDGEQLVRCANKAVMVAAILFIIFVLIGTNLLGIFSVTIQGFKVAGGLVLLLMSMEIIFGMNIARSGDQNCRMGHNSYSYSYRARCYNYCHHTFKPVRLVYGPPCRQRILIDNLGAP